MAHNQGNTHMRKAQQNFLNYLSSMEKLVQTAQSAGLALGDEPAQIENMKAAVKSKELLIPVVGAFSAGKSSLLNAIADTAVLPVAITPETAIATEIRYDSQERIEAVFEDGRTQVFPVSELPILQAAATKPEVVRLYINCPKVQALEPLTLVDMPGFNSPLDTHNKAIAHYIGQGAHYLFVVSVEEGALQTHALRRIEEVVSLGRKFSVCVNKADLRSPSDVNDICSYIRTQLEDEGLPANVCAVSEHDTSSVQALLKAIDPDALLVEVIQPALRQSHLALEGVVNTMFEGLKRDKAANDRTVGEMEDALRELEQEHKQQLASLRGSNLQDALDGVMLGVHNQLARAVDDMARAALRGRDELSRIVSDEVRTSLVVGLKNATDGISAQLVTDFCNRATGTLKPEIHVAPDWTDTLLQRLQTELLPTLMSMIGSNSGETGKVGSTAANVVTTGLLTLGKLAPHPGLKLALIALTQTVLPTVLNSLLGSLSEGQKLENVKEVIRTEVMPSIERSLRPEVSTFLIQAQEQALNLVANSFEQQITAQKNTLAEMCQKASTSNRDEFIAAAQEAQSKLKALGKAYL